MKAKIETLSKLTTPTALRHPRPERHPKWCIFLFLFFTKSPYFLLNNKVVYQSHTTVKYTVNSILLSADTCCDTILKIKKYQVSWYSWKSTSNITLQHLGEIIHHSCFLPRRFGTWIKMYKKKSLGPKQESSRWPLLCDQVSLPLSTQRCISCLSLLESARAVS